jgi:hypothetical protein
LQHLVLSCYILKRQALATSVAVVFLFGVCVCKSGPVHCFLHEFEVVSLNSILSACAVAANWAKAAGHRLCDRMIKGKTGKLFARIGSRRSQMFSHVRDILGKMCFFSNQPI